MMDINDSPNLIAQQMSVMKGHQLLQGSSYASDENQKDIGFYRSAG